MKEITPEVPQSVIETIAKERPMEGVEFWRNKNNGFLVADLEYTADPGKRSQEWIIQSQAGVPKAEWHREFGKRWIIYEGKPVYQDYDEDVHLLKGKIVAPRRSRLISGWDGGPNDVNLAWVLGLVVPDEVAVTWIDEYIVDDGDIKNFVDVVATKLNMEWMKLGGFSLHIADNSVFTKSGLGNEKDGRSMADVMRLHGMPPIPGEISYAKRRNSVQTLMISLFKGHNGTLTPRWRVHERCTVLREAMSGGYAYPKMMQGVGGEYRPKPIKNHFSHIANAMEYASSRLGATDYEVPYEGRTLPMVSLA